jgi:hypothetical protein
MALLTNPIERSVSELRKLQAARNTLEAAVIANCEKLARLRSELGDVELAALLDGGDSKPTRRAIVELETDIDGHNAARPKLLNKIRAAIKVVAHERAETVRGKARKLTDKLAEHDTAVLKLKSALEAAAGCRYEQSVYRPVAPGQLFSPHDIPREAPSIAQRIQAEIDALLVEARRIEQAGERAERGGQKIAPTLDELLAITDDIETLAPTRGQIETWAAEAMAKADAAWQHQLLDFPERIKPERTVQFRLEWDRDGVIAGNSEITNQILHVPAKQATVPAPVVVLGPRAA